METYASTGLPKPQVGYSTGHEDNISISPMESGRTRRRLQYLDETILVGLSFFYTPAQFSTFEAWFIDDLNAGADSFTIELDMGNGFAEYTAHFADDPQAVDNGKHWMVNASIRLESDPHVISEATLDAYIETAGDYDLILASADELDDLVEITLPATTDNI